MSRKIVHTVTGLTGSQTPAEVQSCHEIIATFVHVTVLPLGLPCCGAGWDPLSLAMARSVDVCSDGHLLLRRSWAHCWADCNLFSAKLRDENVQGASGRLGVPDCPVRTGVRVAGVRTLRLGVLALILQHGQLGAGEEWKTNQRDHWACPC